MKRNIMHIRLVVAMSMALTLALFWSLSGGLSVASPATITVTNTNDSGLGSLRQAIADASPDSVIEFSLTYPATIILTSGQLNVNKNLSINGPDAGKLAISGNNTSRIFNVVGGKASLANLTIQDGFAPYGGAIYASDAMTLTNVNILTNTAPIAGGVYIFGPAVILGGLFQNNLCSFVDPDSIGGGLFAANTLVLSGTQFISNSAPLMGGGVYVAGAAAITSGLFQDNDAINGGGIFANSGLVLTGTQFIRNTASTAGGGVYIRPSTSNASRLLNALFVQNVAGNDGSALNVSGAPGSVMVIHTTIANPTVGTGSAIYVTQGIVGITNTIIASQTIGINNTGGTLYQDYNLLFNAPNVGTVDGGTHNTSGDPLFLNPMGNDYHLTEGSSAIDQGVSILWVMTDIDGNHRPDCVVWDVGAYEYQGLPCHRTHLPIVTKH